MKKVIMYYLIVILFLNCTGCSIRDFKNTTPQYNDTQSMYDIERITDNHSYASSKIIYPELVSVTEDFKMVNLLLKQVLDLQVKKMIEESTSNITIEIDYTIPLQSEDLLCVLFEGMLSQDGSAHPSYVAFSVCVSLTKSQIVDPLTLVELDDVFFNNLRNQVTINQNPERFDDVQWKTVAAYISAYSDADIATIISENPSKTLVPQKDGVIVMFPVPYALGDYVKISLRD